VGEALIVIVAAIALGLTAAAIADAKGRDVLGFFFLGALLPIIGLLLIIGLPSNAAALEKRLLSSGESRKCPFCAEVIRAEAKVCRFCGRDLTLRLTGSPSQATKAWAETANRNLSGFCEMNVHERCDGSSPSGAVCACTCHSGNVATLGAGAATRPQSPAIDLSGFCEMGKHGQCQGGAWSGARCVCPCHSTP
jgi:hypothetical protein